MYVAGKALAIPLVNADLIYKGGSQLTLLRAYLDV
jgi:hypothetical protein